MNLPHMTAHSSVGSTQQNYRISHKRKHSFLAPQMREDSSTPLLAPQSAQSSTDIFQTFNNIWSTENRKENQQYEDSLELNRISDGIALLHRMVNNQDLEECLSLLCSEAWDGMKMNYSLLLRTNFVVQDDKITEKAVDLSRYGTYLFADYDITTYHGLYDHIMNYYNKALPIANELVSLTSQQDEVTSEFSIVDSSMSQHIERIVKYPNLVGPYVSAQAIIALSQPNTQKIAQQSDQSVALYTATIFSGMKYVAGKVLGSVGVSSKVLTPWLSISSFAGYMEKQSKLYDLADYATKDLNLSTSPVLRAIKKAIDEIDVRAVKDALQITPFGIFISTYDLIKKALEKLKLKSLDTTAAATILIDLGRDWESTNDERLVALMTIACLCPSINDLAEVISNPDKLEAINQTASWLQP